MYGVCLVLGGGQGIPILSKIKTSNKMVTKIDLDLSFLVIKFSFVYLFPKKSSIEV